MKKMYACLLLQAYATLSIAQAPRHPDGQGHYETATTPCLTPASYERINSMLSSNIRTLKKEGKLPKDWGEKATGLKPTAGTFIWPLKQEPGFTYNSYYGISNYVDLNPLPGNVQDWNCGGRTYDLASGYNHQGVDIFLWPFSQQMQENDQVAIIAATDGVIIGKDDGNPDNSCVMGNDAWNAVYVGNTDGTICWYGHMKTNSLTTKAMGQSVAMGEFLGHVGSSGNSTGPHLHFETHDGAGNILDPYAGPCQASPSLWAAQKPYIEPTINAVMTHDHTPVFPACPQLETINARDVFHPGDSIFFAAYYHDQNPANGAVYTVYRPDNSVFQTWTYAIPQYYTASYLYWYWKVNTTWPDGNWRFTVAYEGNTVSHPFKIEQEVGIDEGESRNASLSVFPNPNHGSFSIKGATAAYEAAVYRVMDIAGREVVSGKVKKSQGTLQVDLPQHSIVSGTYFLQLHAQKGERKILRFTIR